MEHNFLTYVVSVWALCGVTWNVFKQFLSNVIFSQREYIVLWKLGKSVFKLGKDTLELGKDTLEIGKDMLELLKDMLDRSLISQKLVISDVIFKWISVLLIWFTV